MEVITMESDAYKRLVNKIEHVQKPFSALELAFWGKSGIRENILKQYWAVSLKKFSSENADGKPYTLIATEQEPMFGYLGRKHVKVYRPQSQIRFLYGAI